MAYTNDIATSPAAITRATMTDFVPLQEDLAAVGITLALGEALALPPDGHQITSEELQLLAMLTSV